MAKSGVMEISIGLVLLGLCVTLAVITPGYFSRENLLDLLLENIPVLIVALGMTLIILTGQIDISVGSIFAVCAVMAGVFVKSGVSLFGAAVATCFVGAILGAFNGLVVAYLQIPSIVATLATMVALREGLRWATQGAWIENLPKEFQWMGGTEQSYVVWVFGVLIALVATAIISLGYLRVGRAVYATGSNKEAARMSGINPQAVTFMVFSITGTLTGLAALLNSFRFNQIPANTGLGLELGVIAAVVVGGTSITGGSGTILGTVLGVALLGSIGPALTFLGVSAYWEKAIQGGIILVAVVMSLLTSRPHRREKYLGVSPV